MNEPNGALIMHGGQLGYPGVVSLLEVTRWELRPRCLHVLFGPNGSGKSTLLRAMLGLHAWEGGTMTLDGRAWQGVRGTGGGTAAMSLATAMPPRHVGLTVREVLSLSGDPDLACMWLPSLVGMLDRRLSGLSDGQAQQVMVARAMLQSDNWLLLDEPTAFMDYVTTKKVWSLVGQHVEGRGHALVATHDIHGLTQWLQSISQVDVVMWCLSAGRLWQLPEARDASALEASLNDAGRVGWVGPM